ncbi:hypothetical protein K4F52_002786 [Lecanicillium sp. MT-2017a]|nr:hypothetical protein K4F52_002786 [Lecanicillium sp. MT-2017a]
MSSVQRRKRSKLACQTCRDLKRRCDGAYPCGTCVRFEYDCTYNNGGKSKKGRDWGHHTAAAAAHHALPRRSSEQPSADEDADAPPHQHQARSLEANSGAAFVRKLALRLDPKRSTRMHTFAWNAFLGCRQAKFLPTFRHVTDMLSLEKMEQLMSVYFQKVHPVYGILDRNDLEQHARNRWAAPGVPHPQDALFCGVAALACLFSQVHGDATEADLVETARALLEQTTAVYPPTVASISAWILRAVYLRLAGTHYPGWMASCTAMHMIEAAGLHAEPQDSESMIPSPRHQVDAELGRRLVAVAQHLNIWMSFDMGLTRVALSNTTTIMPLARQGEFTRELMELLPFSIELDPERKPSATDLESALHTVLTRRHTGPPSILAQCNLALCLCRRLRLMEVQLSDSVLEQILTLTSIGIQAARDLLGDRAPWHHLAYVPFQILCVLLAIDTVSSISQLRDAMQCLRDVCTVYNTPAMQEALTTARTLVRLHQKGKEMFANALNDVLKLCPSSGMDDGLDPSPSFSQDTEVLDGFNDDFSNLQYLDIDQLLTPGFFWNAGVGVNGL